MGAEIKDEYSELRISRQRKYYLRQRKRHRCTKCGKPAEEGSLCLEHLIQMREYRREKFGLKRRYKNSFSYRAAAKAEDTPTNGNNGHAQIGSTVRPASNNLESTLPIDSGLREIKSRVDTVLAQIAPDLEKLPRNGSQLSPEILLKSWVLSNLYSIRSTRLFCEQLPYNLLWLWFLDLKLGEAQFQPEVFERAYDHILLTDVARQFFGAVFTTNALSAA
jgi:transposase